MAAVAAFGRIMPCFEGAATHHRRRILHHVKGPVVLGIDRVLLLDGRTFRSGSQLGQYSPAGHRTRLAARTVVEPAGKHSGLVGTQLRMPRW